MGSRLRMCPLLCMHRMVGRVCSIGDPPNYPIYAVMIDARCSPEQLIHYACLSVPLPANEYRLVTVPVNRYMAPLRMAIRMNCESFGVSQAITRK